METEVKNLTEIQNSRDGIIEENPSRTCILVLGMHRSGTSAITRVLNLMGAELPQNIMGPGIGNEVGHWEPENLVLLHDQLLSELDSAWDDWQSIDLNELTEERYLYYKNRLQTQIKEEYKDAKLFVLKDPRVCKILPLYKELLEEINVEIKVVAQFRNPIDVMDSLQSRDEMLASDASLLWLQYVLNSEKNCRDIERIFIKYDDVINDWRACYQTITNCLDVQWPYTRDEIETQVDKFISPDHRHHNHEDEEVLSDPLLRQWVGEAYSALLVLQTNPNSENAQKRLDDIAKEFEKTSPILLQIRTSFVGLLEKEADQQQELLRTLAQQNQMLSEQDNHIKFINDKIQAIGDEKQAILRSWSWWLTKPFRAMTNLMRYLKTIIIIILTNNLSRLKPTQNLNSEINNKKKNPLDKSVPSKLFGNVDYLVMRNKTLFCYGWVFCTTSELSNIKFNITYDTGEMSSIRVTYGTLRKDVRASYPNDSYASNCGFSALGAFKGEKPQKIELSVELANGIVHCVPVNTSQSKLNFYSNALGLITRNKIQKGFKLLISGEFKYFFERLVAIGSIFKIERSHLSQEEILFQTKENRDENFKGLCFFDHDLGGGSNKYSSQKISQYIEDGFSVVLVRFDVKTLKYSINIQTEEGNKLVSDCYDNSEIFSLLDSFTIGRFFINNIVSYPQPEELITKIRSYAQKKQIPISVAIHDHYSCCPSHFLLDKSGRYCNLPDIKICRKCLPDNPYGFTSLAESKDVEIWRNHWRDLLAASNEIIFFSKTTKNTFLRLYSDIDEKAMKVIPHQRDLLLNKTIEVDLEKELSIGILGSISYAKGSQIIQELSDEIGKRGLPTKIKIIGQIDVETDNEIVEISGPYNIKNLTKKISSSGANIFLFPSIVPETYSYVVDELMQLGMPIVCFNLGASAERVSNYDLGMVVERSNSSDLLDDVIDFYISLNKNKKLKREAK